MDTALRFRSDRLGLVVPGIDDRDTVVTVAKRLQASLAASYEFDGDTVPDGTQTVMAN